MEGKMSKYNWDKLLFESRCYDIDSDFRNLRHAAGCLAVIPKDIKTPALNKLRRFFEKTKIYPSYLLPSDIVGNTYSFRDLVVGGRDSLDRPREPEEMLEKVKWELYNNLHDAIYNTAIGCNQKVVFGKKQINNAMYTTFPADIKDKENGVAVCRSNYGLLKTAQDIAEELSKERWNTKEMVRNIEGVVNKKWIRENAWDLDEKELKQIDLPKRMGLSGERGT